jgi:hypothetical protein
MAGCGEPVRASNDENLEIDPEKLRFVFQGVPVARFPGSWACLNRRPSSVGEELKKAVSK